MSELLVLLISMALSNHRPRPLPKILRPVEECLPRATLATWADRSGNEEAG